MLSVLLATKARKGEVWLSVMVLHAHYLFIYFYLWYPIIVYLDSIDRLSVENFSISDVFINLCIDDSKIRKYS